jgi:hypothetical protein
MQAILTSGSVAALEMASAAGVEVSKVIARDEAVERHPACHEKIDEARDKVWGRLRPGSRAHNDGLQVFFG